MVLHDVTQGSEAWKDLRLGMPTASQFSRIIRFGSKPGTVQKSDSWRPYVYELATEKVFGIRKQEFDGAAIRWGTEHEPVAADVFARAMGVELMPMGFHTDAKGRYGCSLDRMIKGSNEAVEIKCPYVALNHVGYLIDGMKAHRFPYYAQVQGQLLVSGVDCVHFWSWYPGLPACHIKTWRDETYIGRLAEYLEEFCDDLDAAVGTLERMVAGTSNMQPGHGCGGDDGEASLQNKRGQGRHRLRQN